MANLTPLQLLLWIAGLGMILVPLICILANTLMTLRYKAKEQYVYRLFNNISKAFEGAMKAMLEEMKKKKESEK